MRWDRSLSLSMKRTPWLLVATLLLPRVSPAQGLGGETEAGSDGRGESFFSQYLLYDFASVNVLARYFWVNDVLQRGELALGPSFTFGDGANALKFQFGGTTDREMMAGATLLAKVRGHEVFYTLDGKFATVRGETSTLFQKVFVALNPEGSWQFRVEHLQVGREQGFLRIGVEGRKNLPGNSHLFLQPFYDPIRHKGLGAQAGFRFL